MVNDLIHRAANWVDHNWPLALGVGVAGVITFVGLGCQVTTESPFEAGRAVTSASLTAEVEAYAIKIEAAYADLERQEDAIDRALTTIVGLAEMAGGPAAGTTIATVLGLAGIAVGAGQVGNVKKKNLKIAALKAPPGPVA
jgi:hypothetical protein